MGQPLAAYENKNETITRENLFPQVVRRLLLRAIDRNVSLSQIR